MSGMSFRPIVDTWLLGRPKVKYYGAYPSGFLERARALLGVSITDPVLHVCAGKVRDYPFRGFGPEDETLDLDPTLQPDFVMDVRKLGLGEGEGLPAHGRRQGLLTPKIIAGPVDTVPTAGSGPTAASTWACGPLLSWTRPTRARTPSTTPTRRTRLVALITVFVGYGNQARIFSVFERLIPELDARDRARAVAAIRGKPMPEVEDLDQGDDEGELQAGSRAAGARRGT